MVNYAYDAANRLISVNGQAYTWDNNGNLLSDGLRSYSYDHANRLTQVVSGTLTTEFTYNGVGDRVAKTVDGATTDYVLDPAAGLTQVVQETTGGQATSYLYGHDLLAQYDSGTWAYHVNDGLGSVRQLADPQGEVVQGYSFSPFGVPLGESGGEPYGYTGEQWDASTGLVFLRARYYQPEVGRFINRDPFLGHMARPQTLNAFVYVTNNPLRWVDPSGRQGESPQVPSEAEWINAQGWSEEYSRSALERLIKYRSHIIAAAQRHSFVPLDICSLDENSQQLQVLYALAAIIYRESLGYDKEVSKHWEFGKVKEWGMMKEWAARVGVGTDEEGGLVYLGEGDPEKGHLPSVGIAQIRPETAVQIEQAGLIYEPGPFYDPYTGPLCYEVEKEWAWMPHRKRVGRLLDPIWAIEYAAANMDWATRQEDYRRQIPIYDRYMADWEKMACWYNRGIIDIWARGVRQEDRDALLYSYLPSTWHTMLAIQGTDLLGVKAECRSRLVQCPSPQ